MRLDLYRHGPKNNDPAAHGTGVEALLDPDKLPVIRAHAVQLAHEAERERYTAIEIWTTPMNQAVATGDVVYKRILEEVLGLEASGMQIQVAQPRIHALLGSCAIHPETGEAVNLSSRAMSQIWADAKKSEDYASFEGENKPLAAWFDQGLDNPQGWQFGRPETYNAADLGITLREIAWRVGTFAYTRLLQAEEGTRIVGYGHSGDLEPWAALTIHMAEGRDDGKEGTTVKDMKQLFKDLGGALEPMRGYSIVTKGSDLHLTGAGLGTNEFVVGREVLQEQARLYRTKGKSNHVLAARLRLGGK